MDREPARWMRPDSYLVLEGEVKRLLREVSDDAGEIAPPEAEDPFVPQGREGAVADTVERTGQLFLLDQFVLVLEQQFDTFDGRRARLGDGGCDPGQEEALREAQVEVILRRRHCDCRQNRGKEKFSTKVSEAEAASLETLARSASVSQHEKDPVDSECVANHAKAQGRYRHTSAQVDREQIHMYLEYVYAEQKHTYLELYAENRRICISSYI